MRSSFAWQDNPLLACNQGLSGSALRGWAEAEVSADA